MRKKLCRSNTDKSFQVGYCKSKLQAVLQASQLRPVKLASKREDVHAPKSMKACHAQPGHAVTVRQALPGGQQAGGSGGSAGAGPWDTPLHSPQALLAHAWQVGQVAIKVVHAVLLLSLSLIQCRHSQTCLHVTCVGAAQAASMRTFCQTVRPGSEGAVLLYLVTILSCDNVFMA